MHVRIRRWCALASLLVLPHCQSADETDPATSPDAAFMQQAGTATIGASGGTLTSAGGEVTLQIPAGALDHDVVFTVWKIGTRIGGAVGPAFEIGPTGTVFAKAARLSIRYAGLSLDTRPASDLRVAMMVGDTWEVIGEQMVDTKASLVSGTTKHLSTYALVFEGTGDMDAGVDSPIVVDDASGMDVSTGGPIDGSLDGTSPTVDAGSDAAPPDSGEGGKEAGTAEGGTADAGIKDAGMPEAGMSEAGTTEAGMTEAGMTEAGMTEAGMTEAGMTEAGTTEAGMSEAGAAEAGTSDAEVVDSGDSDGESEAVDAASDAAAVDSGSSGEAGEAGP